MIELAVKYVIPISLAVAVILPALTSRLMGAPAWSGAASGAAFLVVFLGLLNFVTGSLPIALFAGATAAAVTGRMLGLSTVQTLAAQGTCLVGLALPILVL